LPADAADDIPLTISGRTVCTLPVAAARRYRASASRARKNRGVQRQVDDLFISHDVLTVAIRCSAGWMSRHDEIM
jgi:hypothetical protein